MIVLVVVALALLSSNAVAQEAPDRSREPGVPPAGAGAESNEGSPPRQLPPMFPGRRRELVPLFDSDGDGRLDASERRAARAAIEEQRGTRRDPRAGRPPGPPGFPGEPRETRGPEPGPAVRLEDVETYPDASFFDPRILRTLFLDFENDEWAGELEDFRWSDVDVPATLTVDGRPHVGVGVRYRGTSSLMFVPPGRKRSFNLAIDHTRSGQRLGGQRTLNLLNSHGDPTFLRTYLYNLIARRHIPAPRVSFVRVVIGGECWGIYVNQEQFNKDFTQRWFHSKAGVRWKVVGDPRRRSFAFQGLDADPYRRQFVLRSVETERSWDDLIGLCEVLNRSASDCLEEALAPVLDVDGALWFLALDNVFINADGYIFSPTSDFDLYQDPDSRFHLIPRDANETFREAGGRGPGVGTTGVELDPLAGAEDREMPLVERLLSSRRLRARYLAHVRTLAEEWLDWERLRSHVEGAEALISEIVREDTRKLDSFENFEGGIRDGYEERDRRGARQRLGLRRFVTERRRFLLEHPALQRPTPRILSIGLESGEAVATLDPGVRADEVRFHFTVLEDSQRAPPPFDSIEMLETTEGRYSAPLPPLPAGVELRYYVEAQSYRHASADYSPPSSELGARAEIVGGVRHQRD